jgi:hypothetical protein
MGSELKLFKLTERIKRQKENWYERLLRMTTDELPRMLLNYRPRGDRSVGLPVAG